MDTPQFVKSLNSWKTNEYNIDIGSFLPKFYIPTKTPFSLRESIINNELECKIIPGEIINFDADKKNSDKLNPKYPPTCLEQIDSTDWLKKYGLTVNRLSLEQILASIGFKHTEEYVKNVNRTISSKYSKGLFLQTLTNNGSIYNITCNQNKLLEYSDRLKDVVNTYRKRLQWLNNDSRRIFGLITHRNINIIIDCKQNDPKQFDQYRNSVIKLLREQVSKLAKFNLIRCSHEIETFKENTVQVSSDTIDEAIDWLNNWSHCYATMASATSSVEASLLGFIDPTVQAVYLISEGVSSNGSREILYEKVTKKSQTTKIQFNVISYNCSDLSTIEFLRRLAIGSFGPGTFHAYCLLKHVDDYTAGSINTDPTKSLVVMNKKYFGGTPEGSGVNREVLLIFEEMQSAIEILEHIECLLTAMNVKTNNKNNSLFCSSSNMKSQNNVAINISDEEYLSSEEWLKIYGLAKRKLQLFDVLFHVAFRHCDGVVDIKQAPLTGIGDAVPKEKLINAKYCDQFAHVVWNDGTIRHVHVTPEIYRNYEKNIRVALEQFDRRVKWLSKGSRELFGTVIENNIYILIDTSHSMQLSLDFVKQKLFALMQEQLKSKQRFNLVAFNNKISSWRERMVEVDEYNFNDAWKWIKSLNTQGTTNTLAAIRFALADLNTEAIYLLTDGRPDQAPRQILSQVQLNKKVPIHVISFNCNDAEANKFLNQLASETGGRYHYFNENFWSADPNGPIPFESKDISLLKQEIANGLKYLEQVSNLRDECRKISMVSKKENIGVICSKDHSDKEKIFRTQDELEAIEEFKRMKQMTRSSSSLDFRITHIKSQFNKYNKSMLSSINRINSTDWILPETKEILDKQEKREIKIKRSEEKEKKSLKSDIKIIKNNKTDINSELSLKEWLKNNSLKALKLGILDILGPVVVKQNASYIESVDKYVTSKVWNDIFPVTRIEKKNSKGIEIRNDLKLLNPYKVDFENYERKLKDQIIIYRKYLAEKILNSLPSSERNKLDYQPKEFTDETKYILLKSLENCNWPIKEQDIILIEKEIELANKFLQQSDDIRNLIVKSEDIIEKESNINKEQEMLRKSLDKNHERHVSKFNESLDGKTVIARYDKHGYYYEAKVIKQENHFEISVRFENGFEQINMSRLNILRLDGPGSRSFLNLGDYVMALVINEFKYKCYVPGIIQSIDKTSQPRLYIIMYFNGTEGVNTRNELIAIKKNKYGIISNYIREKLGHEQKITYIRETEKEAKRIEIIKPNISIDTLKQEIIESINEHFQKLRLGEKYNLMYEELLKGKEIKRKERHNLKKEIKSLKLHIKKLINEKNESDINYYPQVSDKNIDKPIVEHTETNLNVPKKKLTLSEELEYMKKSLPELAIGEEVLAKWPDDGWYYKSLVKQNCGNYKYEIEDVNKISIKMSREDIISESDADNNVLEIMDPVVALHPSYSFSYAPGIIIKIANNLSLLIRFYDGLEAIVNKEEVYKIPLFKFEYDIDIIINYEKRWVGQTVIARNPFNFVYELGRVKERIGNGRQYVIEWSGDRTSVQTANHIFGVYTHKPFIDVNNFVLASKSDIYLPGRVIGTKGKSFIVKFIDNTINEEINAEDCFWLSSEYYEDACNFYRRKILN